MPPEVTVANLDLASITDMQVSRKKEEVIGRPGESVQSAYIPPHDSQSKHSLQVSMAKIKKVFTLLVEESSFLIEDKVKERT